MPRFLSALLCLLSFMYSETQAKVAPPNQVSSISFEWGGSMVELSQHREPWKMPKTRPIRQFYCATVRTSDGRKQELKEEAAPISPSCEADVQMIRYKNILAEFSVGAEVPHVQLGKNAQVHLYSPRADEPIVVRAHGLRIRLHTELADGKDYFCVTITTRKGKPRTVRQFLWKTACGVPTPIKSIEPGVQQPGNKLYLTLQIGAFRCVLDKDGNFIMCEPPVTSSEINS